MIRAGAVARLVRLARALPFAAFGLFALSLGDRPALSQRAETLVIETPAIGRVDRLAVWHFGDVPYLRARDLGRVIGASLHWKADLGRLELRAGIRSARFTMGNRFVVLDEGEALQLADPPRLEAGEIYLPAAVFEEALAGNMLRSVEREGRRIVIVERAASRRRPSLRLGFNTTELRIPTRLQPPIALVSTRASRFVLRMPRARIETLPGDTLQRVGLVEELRFRRSAEDLWTEIHLHEGTWGYRVTKEEAPDRVIVEFTSIREREDFVALAPEFGDKTELDVRVIVIDAGHGGPDSGVVVAGVAEKNLTLALAVALRRELVRRLPHLRVVLTRERDVALSVPARVERANRERADLYLSLHADAMQHTDLSGITAVIAPPALADHDIVIAAEGFSRILGRPRPRPVHLIEWREAAGRHHGEARNLAEQLLASLAIDGYGPSRLRVAPSYPTEGIDCPAVLLECGALQSERDRDLLLVAGGVDDFASAVARSLTRYVEGETWP